MHLVIGYLFIVSALANDLAAHFNTPLIHYYTEQISKQLAESIKIKLVQNISMISNQTFGRLLLNDLFQVDDSKRVLKSADVKSCNQIFAIFNLKPPLCDKNKDNIVEGTQLKCLNKIWKYFIPSDQQY